LIEVEIIVYIGSTVKTTSTVSRTTRKILKDRDSCILGHLMELLPAAGAVQRCGFVDLVRDGLQGGHQHEEAEWPGPPDVGDQHRPERVRSGQPEGVLPEDVVGVRTDR
jgi:hypothetical protein